MSRHECDDVDRHRVPIPFEEQRPLRPVGTIASGHACLAIRSFLALESDSVEIPDWQNVVHWDGRLYRDGYLELPNTPGLGIDLNEEICRKYLAPGSKFFV